MAQCDLHVSYIVIRLIPPLHLTLHTCFTDICHALYLHCPKFEGHVTMLQVGNLVVGAGPDTRGATKEQRKTLSF